jgi:AraC-like DNA-binding protein
MHDDLIFLASTRAPRSRGRVDKYLDGYFTIQLMSESAGPMDLFYDERHWTLEGDWFYPAFPGVHTRFHPANAQAYWFHRHVGFQGPLVSRWQAAGWWPNAPQRPPAGKDYVAFFDEIIFLVRRSDEWARLRAINLVEQLLLELAEDRAALNIRAPDKWLGQLLGRLEENNTLLDYECLAREMGLSLTALRRRFKDATGVPLHTWVLQNRVARARTLLAESDLPLKAIATQLGYNNVYFFARQFKQIAGVAPGHYRRSRL